MTKAIITMNDSSTMTLELYPSIAPITVENFTKLAKSGFYDGLVFHRVIRNFMIQGGDPEGTGMGGTGHHIKGDYNANGVNNTIKHTRGVISMARSNDYDSAGSQFFLMHKDSVHLDGQYAAFGKVIEGIETVDAIAQQKTDYSDRPVVEQKIKTIVIEE